MQKNGNQKAQLVKQYFKLFYQFSIMLGYDIVLGMVRHKDIKLHEQSFGAKVLCRNTQETYGSEHQFATMAWRLDNLKPMSTQHVYVIFISHPADIKSFNVCT